MKITKEKQNALWLIALALVLHTVASNYITVTDSSYGVTAEGPGLFLSSIGLVFWVLGFIKYARAKGRSELLAILLSFFWIVGLVILLVLQDIKKSKKPA